MNTDETKQKQIDVKQIEELLGQDRRCEVVLTHERGGQSNRRVARSNTGVLMFMLPKSKRRGYFIDSYSLKGYVSVRRVEKRNIPIEVKWIKQIDRAIKMLEVSGLWENILINLKLAREIGYETINKAYELSWLHIEGMDYYEQCKLRVQKIKELEPRLIYVGDYGETYNTEILWHLRFVLKIKKMNFGKQNNEFVLTQIKNAMDKKEKYSSGIFITNYDTSFEYNPECNKAWYSEEFKGCGNGHYYLALNGTHAMFYEDD